MKKFFPGYTFKKMYFIDRKKILKVTGTVRE